MPSSQVPLVPLRFSSEFLRIFAAKFPLDASRSICVYLQNLRPTLVICGHQAPVRASPAAQPDTVSQVPLVALASWRLRVFAFKTLHPLREVITMWQSALRLVPAKPQ